MIAIPVSEQSQVAEARRAAADFARSAGFGEADLGRVAIVATELATNLVKHGQDGRLLAGLSDSPRRRGLNPAAAHASGIDLIAIDKGPGVADWGAASRDGYSTAGSAGHGLGAIRRQAQALHVYSRPGSGTALLARIEAGPLPTRFPAQGGPRAECGPAEDRFPGCGAVCVAKPGEDVCGDDWHVTATPGEPSPDGDRTLMVVDGLGHGPQAAEAAAETVRLFKKHAALAPAAIMDALQAGLRATRGAAVSIARFDCERRVVVFCGVGNVAGALVSRRTGQVQRLVTHNGTVGYAVRRVRALEYPYDDEAILVLHSDGLSANWSLAGYPGLIEAHPSLIAAVLYRDFHRDRDDATVLVASDPGGDRGP